MAASDNRRANVPRAGFWVWFRRDLTYQLFAAKPSGKFARHGFPREKKVAKNARASKLVAKDPASLAGKKHHVP